MSQILSPLHRGQTDQKPSPKTRSSSGSGKSGDCVAAGRECGLLSTQDKRRLAAFRPHTYNVNESRYQLLNCGTSYERHSLNDQSCCLTAGAAEQQDAKGYGALMAHMAGGRCHTYANETLWRSGIDVANMQQLMDC